MAARVMDGAGYPYFPPPSTRFNNQNVDQDGLLGAGLNSRPPRSRSVSQSDRTIHSGHFMVSNLSDDDDDYDAVGDKGDLTKAFDDTSLASGLSPVEALATPELNSVVSPAGSGYGMESPALTQRGAAYDFGNAEWQLQDTYMFGSKATNQLSIDESLVKMFDHMKLAYSGKISSPKWKHFKGHKVKLKDKIRLNNVIWREWHMQYIQHRRPIVCQFEAPVVADKSHVRSEAVVLEGKYWKSSLKCLAAEYQKWRQFFKKRFPHLQKDHLMEEVASHAELLDRIAQTKSAVGCASLYYMDPAAALFASEESMLIDDDIPDFSDTLFSTLGSHPFQFPDPREFGAQLRYSRDIVQPGLIQLQPSLGEMMDTSVQHLSSSVYGGRGLMHRGLPMSCQADLRAGLESDYMGYSSTPDLFTGLFDTATTAMGGANSSCQAAAAADDSALVDVLNDLLCNGINRETGGFGPQSLPTYPPQGFTSSSINEFNQDASTSFSNLADINFAANMNFTQENFLLNSSTILQGVQFSSAQAALINQNQANIAGLANQKQVNLTALTNKNDYIGSRQLNNLNRTPAALTNQNQVKVSELPNQNQVNISAVTNQNKLNNSGLTNQNAYMGSASLSGMRVSSQQRSGRMMSLNQNSLEPQTGMDQPQLTGFQGQFLNQSMKTTVGRDPGISENFINAGSSVDDSSFGGSSVPRSDGNFTAAQDLIGALNQPIAGDEAQIQSLLVQITGKSDFSADDLYRCIYGDRDNSTAAATVRSNNNTNTRSVSGNLKTTAASGLAASGRQGVMGNNEVKMEVGHDGLTAGMGGNSRVALNNSSGITIDQNSGITLNSNSATTIVNNTGIFAERGPPPQYRGVKSNSWSSQVPKNSGVNQNQSYTGNSLCNSMDSGRNITQSSSFNQDGNTENSQVFCSRANNYQQGAEGFSSVGSSYDRVSTAAGNTGGSSQQVFTRPGNTLLRQALTCDPVVSRAGGISSLMSGKSFNEVGEQGHGIFNVTASPHVYRIQNRVATTADESQFKIEGIRNGSMVSARDSSIADRIDTGSITGFQSNISSTSSENFSTGHGNSVPEYYSAHRGSLSLASSSNVALIVPPHGADYARRASTGSLGCGAESLVVGLMVGASSGDIPGDGSRVRTTSGCFTGESNTVVNSTGVKTKKHVSFVVPQNPSVKPRHRLIAPAPVPRSSSSPSSLIDSGLTNISDQHIMFSSSPTNSSSFLNRTILEGLLKHGNNSTVSAADTGSSNNNNIKSKPTPIAPHTQPSAARSAESLGVWSSVVNKSSYQPITSVSASTQSTVSLGHYNSSVTDFQRNLVMAAASQAVGVATETHSKAGGGGDFFLVPTPRTVFSGSTIISSGRPASRSASISPDIATTAATDCERASQLSSISMAFTDDIASGADQRRVHHMTAEQRRRGNIKSGFEMLNHMVPSLVEMSSSKINKATTLQRTAEMCKRMKREREASLAETERLRQEIIELQQEISLVQSQLPATGLPVVRPQQHADKTVQMCEEYVRVRTLQNWKFWIFSFIIRPLFQSYTDTVVTSSADDLCRTSLAWLDRHCSLVSLRPAVLNSLRQLSKSTTILSDPHSMARQATQAVQSPAQHNR